jgi:hypothetical protein
MAELCIFRPAGGASGGKISQLDSPLFEVSSSFFSTLRSIGSTASINTDATFPKAVRSSSQTAKLNPSLLAVEIASS